MQTLTVIGASGRTGAHIVAQALAAGLQVRAVMRDASRLGLQHPALEKVQADVTVIREAAGLCTGADAVVVAVGDRDLGGEITVMQRTMATLIPAMKEAAVSRIIALSGAGVLQHDAHSLLREQPDFPAFLLKVSQDHWTAWQMLQASTLNWTLVCPPQIIDAPATGHYLVQADYFPQGQNRIHAGDIASFVLHELRHNQFLRKRAGITH